MGGGAMTVTTGNGSNFPDYRCPVAREIGNALRNEASRLRVIQPSIYSSVTERENLVMAVAFDRIADVIQRINAR